jgi:hypothetical protein
MSGQPSMLWFGPCFAEPFYSYSFCARFRRARRVPPRWLQRAEIRFIPPIRDKAAYEWGTHGVGDPGRWICGWATRQPMQNRAS